MPSSCKNGEMGEARWAVACTQCQVHWYVDDEPGKCTDPRHDHQQFALHEHLSVVVLPNGTEVTAASFNARDPDARDQPPDYGLYLDRHWQPPWTHDHLEWPDFGVPEEAARVAGALRIVLNRACGRDRVEVGCLRRPWSDRNGFGLPRHHEWTSFQRCHRRAPRQLLHRRCRDRWTKSVYCRFCRLTPTPLVPNYPTVPADWGTQNGPE